MTRSASPQLLSELHRAARRELLGEAEVAQSRREQLAIIEALLAEGCDWLPVARTVAAARGESLSVENLTRLRERLRKRVQRA